MSLISKNKLRKIKITSKTCKKQIKKFMIKQKLVAAVIFNEQCVN